MRALFPGSFDPVTQGHQIDVAIRGVRGVSDLDYEMPMARMNHELAGVETFFIAADPALAHVSSTLVTATRQLDHVPE
ncbi:MULTISPECIES: hypothetical protein [unclassified Streptomyces]|uniref:hypothetical protein n=1 Tax=unclassified Streptomyces TaxID=2593676 RepID=UPI002E79A42D|nr:hypothetical protein [Streptomyces sp. JV184]MEE1743263.1 hypothetical protein [Streptomyces sp. JV184]